MAIEDDVFTWYRDRAQVDADFPGLRKALNKIPAQITAFETSAKMPAKETAGTKVKSTKPVRQIEPRRLLNEKFDFDPNLL